MNKPVLAGSVAALAACVGAIVSTEASERQAPAEWKVGLAQLRITPERPVFLAGYASRNRPFEKVSTDLWAKAMAFEDLTGGKAVLVTTDLLGIPASIAEPVCAKIQQQTGLRRDQILLTSSHTHAGPIISPDPLEREGLPPEAAEHTAAYTRQLQERLINVAVRAVEHVEPARLSYGWGVANFVMNRREFTPNGVILGVNPKGPADRSVPVLRVDSPDGKMRAVVFGAAVHNTTLTGDNYEVSGDYAGFAQTTLTDRYPGVQAMFVLGCAGDANPYPRSTMDIAKEHGATLGREVGRVLDSGKLQPVRGPIKTAFGRADLPLQPPPPKAQLEKDAEARGTTGFVARTMLKILNSGKTLPTTYPAPVAVWQFGEDLTLVSLSGEVVVDYVALIEKALGPLRLWVAAYANDVYGYLPSARVISEGGYETRGIYDGGIGYFTPKAQDVLVAKVRELATQVGRPQPK